MSTSAWNRAALTAALLLLACDPFPRVNPLDPQCNKALPECDGAISPSDASGDGTADGGGGAVLVVGTVSISMIDTKCVDLNNDRKLQAGETARVSFPAKNTGTAPASIIASLENVPTSLTITNCVENATGTSTACTGACSCDSTLNVAQQWVGPGGETPNPVLYFYVKVAGGTPPGTINIPVRFTSVMGGSWNDQAGLTVSP